MSKCCASANDAACSLPAAKPGVCRTCGKKGKTVSTLTVKSLVRDHTQVSTSVTFSFCRTAECEVVYFSDQSVFRKHDLKVRVGVKEATNPIPLCYCFEYSRQDIRHDIETTGNTSILEKIKDEVRSGFCACEVKNPSGTCCLGDIANAVRESKQNSPQPLADHN